MSAATIQQNLQIALDHQRQRQFAQAEAIYRQILLVDPNCFEALHLLGTTLLNLGQSDEAIAIGRRAVALRPDFPGGRNNLGNALQTRGLLEEAIAEYLRAIALDPQIVEAHNNLGNALRALGRWTEAIAAYRRAIELRPTAPEPHTNLGSTLLAAGNPDQAIQEFEKSLAIRPHQNIARSNLANALKDLGRLDEAIACYDLVLADQPDQAVVHSNRSYTLLYHPGYDAQAILHENQIWNRQHAAPLTAELCPHPNDRSPAKRLRIGYISPNFCDHCQALFLTPLLANHDREQFEILCYSDVLLEDSITARLREYANQWRSIVGISDQDVAGMIRGDGIDILVDLSLHMSRNRLLAFARKPAPVQVTWLGYPGTTGLETIDYRFTDPYLDPLGDSDGDYSETSIRLTDTFWCYDPLCQEPNVSDLPMLKNGFVTFGCLNNFCKVNDRALETWANVLQKVPNSRLILLAPPGSARETVRIILNRFGVESTRITFADFQPRLRYLNEYHRIDIGLDTFPYNGHTTTLDSLWMGVPVITLVGKTVVGRAGLSQLTNLGLQELAAHSPDEFVRIAEELAGDTARLSQLRSDLRQKMRASPLMDAPRFARAVEQAYQTMWNHFVRR